MSPSVGTADPAVASGAVGRLPDMAATPRASDVNPGTAILDAGRRLAAERGSGFTTQDVIKEAGVALQTFYRYYGGKDQLLLALIADLISGYADGLRVQIADVEDPLAQLELCVRSTIAARSDPEADPGAGRFITSEHWRLHDKFPDEIVEATQPVTSLIREILEAGAGTGAFATDQPDRDAWLITKLIMSVFHHLAFVPDDPAAPDADAVWAFCRAAVTGPRGAVARTRRTRRS